MTIPEANDPLKNGRTLLSSDRQQAVSDFIHQRFGLHFPSSHYGDMLRALQRAVEESGFENLRHYTDWLLSGQLSDKQLEPLITNLTIGETYFFRDSALFEGLQNVLLPGCLGAEKPVRIWSAGCSTGEEPYSLAILLDQMGLGGATQRVEVYATDVNVKSLAKARQAVYSRWSFRGVSEAVQQRYFCREGEHHWRLAEKIRRQVHFSYLNLANSPFVVGTNDCGRFDIILCRNVLMYFSEQRRAAILEIMAAMLTETGWLIVSPSEVGLVRVARLKTVNVGSMQMHRNTDGQSAAVPVAGGSHPPQRVQPRPLMVARPAAVAALPPRCAAPKKVAPPAMTVSHNAADRPLQSALNMARQRDSHAAVELLLPLLKGLAAGGGESFDAMLVLGRSLANLGRSEEAEQWLTKAIQGDRLQARAHYLLATVQQERGALDAAKQSLTQALYLEPDFIMATVAMGMLLAQGGQKAQAHRQWQHALRLLDALAALDAEALVPESEGVTVSHLRRMLSSLL